MSFINSCKFASDDEAHLDLIGVVHNEFIDWHFCGEWEALSCAKGHLDVAWPVIK